MTVPNPETQPLLTITQAALVLGVSRATAYRAAQAGELPTITLSARMYVPTAALRKHLHLDEVPTEPPATSLQPGRVPSSWPDG